MAWSEAKTVQETPSAGRAFAATAYDAERVAAPPREEGDDPLIGKPIDHFEVRALLGEGGMGRVYLAHDRSLDRPVALKLLRRELADDATLMARLVDEARAQARLQHPNVVTIYHIGHFEGSSYFVMEYVRGRTLAEVLEHDGPLTWGDALDYVVQTARALATAHERGMIHRDIKPSNIILGDVAKGDARAGVKVADFGLATSDEKAAGRFVGTPYYAAPEQIAGAAPDLRSDIYTLGVTFHELLTGHVPFKADNLEAMASLHGSAPRPHIASHIAPWRLRQLIHAMMDPEPQKRPQTYDELLSRLEALRPTPRVAGGLLPRGVALAIDLMLFAPIGQIVAGAMGWTQQTATEIWLALFGTYYVLSHRLWGKTLGKRLLGLHVVGTTRRVHVLGLVLRFVVEFWGPLAALAIISLQLGAVADLLTVKERVVGALGSSPLPLWDRGVNAVLRTMLVPNSIVGIPWLASFLFALIDRDRQTLHDRAARTRVLYEGRVLEEESKHAAG